MIDRIRLTAAAKNQLVVLKRRTGIQHYNALCRHAICLSLESDSELPEESFNFNGGLEIEWGVLSGGTGDTLVNLIQVKNQSLQLSDKALRDELIKHIHRGLSLMLSRSDALFYEGLKST